MIITLLYLRHNVKLFFAGIMQMWLVIFRGGLSSKETLTIQVSGKGVKAPHLYNLSID